MSDPQSRMHIALLEGPRQFRIDEWPIPEIRPDEVLVRVAACGVCTSDLHPWETDGTNLPRALGHEVSGVVAKVGEKVTDFFPGDPVAVWATGQGFAEYVAVKAEHCFPAGDVPLDLALAEPLACAVNAVEMADVSLGDDVVIIGAGFMGTLVHKLVALRGPRQVIVADPRADALRHAELLGATRTVNPGDEVLDTVVKDLTLERGADVTFEVAGVQSALLAAGNVTRMSGTIVIVGYHQGEDREIPLGYWNWMAFRIANAHFRDESVILRGMKMGMRLLTSRQLSMADLVTHRFPLNEIEQAFATAVEKPDGFVKSTVVLDEHLLPAG
jgi:threonine dehydrogenase-like Zn-dependent dehydrogenase